MLRSQPAGEPCGQKTSLQLCNRTPHGASLREGHPPSLPFIFSKMNPKQGPEAEAASSQKRLQQLVAKESSHILRRREMPRREPSSGLRAKASHWHASCSRNEAPLCAKRPHFHLRVLPA